MTLDLNAEMCKQLEDRSPGTFEELPSQALAYGAARCFRNVSVLEQPANTFTVRCSESGREAVIYKYSNGIFSSTAPNANAYVRVDGLLRCECGRQAREHDPSELTDEAGDTLRLLCDSRLVKT